MEIPVLFAYVKYLLYFVAFLFEIPVFCKMYAYVRIKFLLSHSRECKYPHNEYLCW